MGRLKSTTELQLLRQFDEDEVFGTYLELGSIRKLCRFLGQVMGLTDGEGDPKPLTTLAFYTWLDDEDGRRDTWEQVMEWKSQVEAEEMIELADTADLTNLQLRRLMVDARAKAAAMRGIGQRGKVEVNLSLNAAWLTGMKLGNSLLNEQENDRELLPPAGVEFP